MKQTRKILPVYTSDVSGVCSALYEMGGMVVMHDPSGCNSTYNTHDEIRWYDKDSLIFISGLTERDAVMGNDEKFIRDVLDTARSLHPAFMAITNSPIPYLMGTDFPAITRRLERESGIPAFYVPANGMHDYTAGAGKAFERVAGHLVDPAETSRPGSINLLGLTPLDYAAAGSAASLRNAFEAAGFEVLSVWSMGEGADLKQIRRSGEAAVNVVVSSAGLGAAKVLQARFGTPYVVGTPAGGFTEILMREIRDMVRGGTDEQPDEAGAGWCRTAYLHVPRAETFSCGSDAASAPVGSMITLVGEPVIMGSLAAAIRLKYGRETQVVCPTEQTGGLLRKGDLIVHGEEETQEVLAGACCVIADPFYQWICPPGTEFYPLPTLSLSGRSHLKETINLSEVRI